MNLLSAMLRVSNKIKDKTIENLPVFVKEDTFAQLAPKFVDFQRPLPDRAPKKRIEFMFGSTARRYAIINQSLVLPAN